MDSERLSDRISVLVLSFDGFSDLWAPFFDSFFKAWPGCPFPVYLMTNERSFDHPKVQSLRLGKDVSWSDNLSKALMMIPTDYVFLFYEDAFLKRIRVAEMSAALEYCVGNKLDSLLLMPSKFRGKQKVNSFISRVNKDALYRNSLFVNVIKKSVLLHLLRPGENAWQYEIIGNERSRQFDFYCVNRQLIFYDHGIVKGKWLYKAKKKLEREGYRFPRLNKSLSFIDQLIYDIKLGFFNFYISTMPLKILLKLERMRSSGKRKYL